MNKNAAILPIVILLSSLILGGTFYASQISKQNSIEKQQRIELQAKKESDQAKADEAKAQERKDRADKVFSNNLRCQTLLKDLKGRWNNVVGIYYSELQNTCIVKYTVKSETQEAPIEEMQDI